MVDTTMYQPYIVALDVCQPNDRDNCVNQTLCWPNGFWLKDIESIFKQIILAFLSYTFIFSFLIEILADAGAAMVDTTMYQP
jgi:hypothetical protein